MNKCFLAGGVNLVILLHVFGGWRVSVNPEFFFYVDTHWLTNQTRKCLLVGNGHTY